MNNPFFQSRALIVLLLASLGLSFVAGAADKLPSPSTTERVELPIAWRTDYHAGLDEAAERGLMALVWFYDPVDPAVNDRWQREVVSQQPITARIHDGFIPIRLPVMASVDSGGKEVVLLEHPAFAEMRRSPGLVIIDMTDAAGPLHRQVVSVYPFKRQPIAAEKLAVLLSLPRGSLTQRTLIFAVRTHPELPASTSGHFSHLLSRESEKHAHHQASIALQGHHNWESRFHAINASLPGSLLAKEVCAESWPGQPLVDAAEECVHSWRQSSGHWEAVRSPHLLFGYDMKRGANGVWYAAGIFAGR